MSALRVSSTVQAIDEWRKQADFIIQGEQDTTFSANIIFRFKGNHLGFTLTDLYKNTQNVVTGNFVRLFGSFNIVKDGYPPVAADAPVLNVNPVTGQREPISTRVIVMLPLAATGQRAAFFACLEEELIKNSIPYQKTERDTLPPSGAPSALPKVKVLHRNSSATCAALLLWPICTWSRQPPH